MKILLSESQYKRLLENDNRNPIINIRDIAEIINRQGFDEDIVRQIFISAFRHFGDEGVVDLFEKFTSLRIEPISRGKYIFSYS